MLPKIVIHRGYMSWRGFALLNQHLVAKWISYSTAGCHKQNVVLTSTHSSVNSNLSMSTQRNMTSSASVARKETKIGSQLVYHQYHPEETESGKKTPLVLFLPWITANQRSAQRFEDLYGIRGFNVLTVWSSVKHFLWPKSGIPLANEVVTYLLNEVKGDLVVHGMSIGAYMYTIILMEAIKRQEAVNYFSQHVKGNVFDSIVCGGLHKMAVGVSKMMFANIAMEKILTASMMTYFALTKKHTVEKYDVAIQQFYDNPFTPSALMFYSTVDRMSDPTMVEEICLTWKERGAHVRMKKWDDAGHAEFFRVHPTEYIEIIDEYLAHVRPSDRPYKPEIAKL